MGIDLRRYVYPFGWGAALVGALFLQGCAPGFSPTSAYEADQALPPEFQYLPADGASEGVITSISPALIRALAETQSTAVPSEVKVLFGESPVYTIGPGDVVGVIVYDHPELLPNAGAVISQTTDPTGVSVAPGFIVGATGLISFPYIGRIKLQGLTEIEASDLIAQRISKYIKDPQVTVRIQSFRSRRAFVEGEVRSPGLQIFTDVPMTLAEAISRAGGITANGDRSFVTLTRGEKTTLINLQNLQDVGADASRIPLQNGDIVQIRNRDESKIYVMGEILRPSALLMHNGRLTLNEALGEAGGPNLGTAHTGQIYVIRNNARGTPAIFHLNAKNPAALALAERFPLQPRDVVYIDPVPLVTWNRLVSLILPSAQVINTGDEIWSRHR
ncbi:polysaccharide biosynthesis/export family protein [Variovorax paradoxus]|uniref:polysaccharide biosynthesis/export family protein n=1 Tax=Variovorax TaxID=34072 RepID=UPI001ABBEF98